jgi:hypothetical protein
LGRVTVVRRNKETTWQLSSAAGRLGRFGNGHPSNRKGELPMEITAKLTAMMAIVSFGFVAAVILGMI